MFKKNAADVRAQNFVAHFRQQLFVVDLHHAVILWFHLRYKIPFKKELNVYF